MEKQYKTPEYMRKAQREYVKRKIEADPEYLNKRREKYREYARKKREKLKSQLPTN